MIKRFGVLGLIFSLFLLISGVFGQGTDSTPIVTDKLSKAAPNLFGETSSGVAGFKNTEGDLISSYILNKDTGIPFIVHFSLQNKPVTDSTAAEMLISIVGNGIFRNYTYSYVEVLDLTAPQQAIPNNMASRVGVPISLQQDSVLLVTFNPKSHVKNEKGYVTWNKAAPLKIDADGSLITRNKSMSVDSLGSFTIVEEDTVGLVPFDGSYSFKTLGFNSTTAHADSISYALGYRYKINGIGWIVPTDGEEYFSISDSTGFVHGVEKISGRTLSLIYADSIQIFFMGLDNTSLTVNKSSVKLRE